MGIVCKKRQKENIVLQQYFKYSKLYRGKFIFFTSCRGWEVHKRVCVLLMLCVGVISPKLSVRILDIVSGQWISTRWWHLENFSKKFDIEIFFWFLNWFTDWYDWLIDWLIGTDWLIDWLVGWLVGWLVANLLYGWWSMVGRLGNFWEFSTYKILWIFFLIDRCLIQLNFWLSDWLIDWLIGCLVIPLRIWIGIYGWETHKILRTSDLQNFWHFLCIEC